MKRKYLKGKDVTGCRYIPEKAQCNWCIVLFFVFSVFHHDLDRLSIDLELTVKLIKSKVQVSKVRYIVL